MYAVIIYDVSIERINKVRQFLKRYLNWVQNSAFEGELTEAQLMKIKLKLKELIDEKQDSILLYSLSSQKWLKKDVIGIEKSEISTII